MVTKTVTILNPLGIHARPSGCIVGLAVKYKTEQITLFFNNQKANAKSIMDILSLAMTEGSEVKVEVEGNDENYVLEAICEALVKIYEYED
jgi:phosphocarrier protein